MPRAGMVYHWKHGWIPLTHAAAMSKAKGNRAAAIRYLNAHPATAGGKKDFTAAETFRMTGPDLRQHATSGSKAAQDELDRRAAKRASKAPSSPTKAPEATRAPASTSKPAASMTEDELKAQLTSSNERKAGAARAELRRRNAAAEKAKRPGMSYDPGKTLTPAELHEQNRGGLKVGDEVALRVTGSNGLRIGTVQGFAADGRPQVHVPGHGTVTRSADGMSTTIPAATRDAERKRQVGDWSKTPTATLQGALTRPGFLPGQHEAMRQELDRRGAPHARPEPPAAATPTAPSDEERRQQEHNDRIAPAGYKIHTKLLPPATAGGQSKVMHVQRTTADERVGSVVEQPGGEYRAMYQGSFVGTFTSQKEAHARLAAIHDGNLAKAKAEREAKAERDARNAVSNTAKSKAVAADLARNGVHWQPHTFTSDGSRAGDAAAAKIKQSFKSGNHTVHIETAMSREQTKALLTDISAVASQANVHDRSITFHVPAGDKHFRPTRRGTVGGYVRDGQSTVFINPKVASGDLADQFGRSENFMPALARTTGRRYVLTHEVAHVIDHQDHHTAPGLVSKTPSGMVLPTYPSADVQNHHREHKSELSTYGKKNPAEGYAEAYAQWVHGGPGSSKVADAYARRFGWTPPATKPT